MRQIKDRVGEVYKTNEGYEVEIIEYFSSKNVSILFKQDGIILRNLYFCDVKRGRIRNYNHKSILNIGYRGYGVHTPTENKKATKCYIHWQSMLSRCYNKKSQKLSKNNSYIGCSVDKRWHNFQNFAEWYYKNYNPETMQGWHLDKDILIKSNKVYSPETCCFVPQEINSIFLKTSKKDNLPTGVQKSKNNSYMSNFSKGHKRFFKTVEKAFDDYKTKKEADIKCIANRWRDKISPETYQALLNYKVEITD